MTTLDTTQRTDVDEQAFRDERRQGIGGSDVAAIVGLDPWRTPLDVYLEKLGEHPDDGRDNEAMHWGRILEDPILNETCRRLDLERSEHVANPYVHPTHAWARVNVDGLATRRGDVAAGVGVLEAKTTSAWRRTEWDDRNDEAPAAAVVQCTWGMAVREARWGAIGGLVGGQRLHTAAVERDDELVRMLLERCGEFWHDHVLARRPPPATGRDRNILEAVYDVTEDTSIWRLPAGDQVALWRLVGEYRDARAAAKAADETKNEVAAQLAERLGRLGIERLTADTHSGPRPLVSWARPKPRKAQTCPQCDHVIRPAQAQADRRLNVTTRKEL